MNNPLFSAHSDVLQAPIPKKNKEQERLWHELKTRGKAAVLAGQWPVARQLYAKALEVVQVEADGSADGSADANKAQVGADFKTGKEQAVVYSNLALLHGKMHEWDAALRDSTSAVEADATYVKGWWRLGQAQAAQGKFEKAVAALEKGLALEPTNKALTKELEKMCERKVAASVAALEKSTAAATVTAAATNKSTRAPTTTTSSSAASVNATEQGAKSVEGVDFTTSEHVKGYKIVNGKKTSYFHNELTDQAKALIGDIAPKKLDPVVGSATGTATGEKGKSVWNQAGTWEEKNVSTWAIESLQAQLEATVFQLPLSSPAPGASVTVTSAVVTGHASVATVRGKTRLIYELSAVVDWKLVEHIVASGSLTFPDIDGTCMEGEPYDCTDFTVRHADDDTIRPVLDTFVHRQGLRDALHENIDGWVRLFRDTY